jgi:ribosome assembly protein RRB1
VFDNSAYQMLHRAKVEWPCLSMDVLLRERIGSPAPHSAWFPQHVNQLDPKQSFKDDKRGGLPTHKQDRFPYTVYFCSGSQSLKKSENRIYVQKWSDMQKTLRDDEELDSDEEESDLVKDPIMRFETVPHKGCVNRIRSMHGSGVVATWNDDNEVGIYDVTSAVEALDEPVGAPKKKTTGFGGTKIAAFRHTDEGFALDWSPLTLGRLAAGSCNSQIYLYQPADETCSSFVKEISGGLQSHKKSVEDVQFSPSQEHVLASCSVDQTVKLWDLRATQMKAQISFRAHDCDVNVISWNSTSKFLLASGDDKGEFRIWDLRMVSPASYEQKGFDSITRIRWHTQAITSLQFEPGEDSVLAVSSADNKLTIWDFSVEVDDQ